MIGTGKTLYHLTYIDDLIEGFIKAGTRPEAVNGVFTIAGERYTTLNELIGIIANVLSKHVTLLKIPIWPVYVASVVCDKLCKSLGIAPPLYPRRVEFFMLDRAFSINKAKKMLGYQPKVDLYQGIRKTAAWYIEKGLI